MSVIKKRYGATDGWIKMPDGNRYYIFGFCDITGVSEEEIFSYRGKATLLAPLLEVNEGDKVNLTLTNLGLPERPDLDDTHTIHWHGFPNQIPFWDGVPEASISVPVGRDFEYYYQPQDPGTYMYHCHFEPTEHIQMGMVGPLIVRPALEQKPENEGNKYVYNDPATEFDREFIIFLSELDIRPHELIVEAQEFDWTEYEPQYWLINGRSYPDTVKEADDPEFSLQPFSAKLEAYPGERVLLRFINLGFQDHCLQMTSISMKIIGLDAQQLRGYNGEDISQWTNSLYIAPGQTMDVLLTAPEPGKYILYNREHHKNTNAGNSFGGMITDLTVLEP